LACGDVGAGKLEDPESIVSEVIRYFTRSQKLKGKKILVTAGPTQEPIDPVRYISNRSSGKMGYAIATEALKEGAEVVLISGPTNLTPPAGVVYIGVTTTKEMFDAVMAQSDADVIIKAAAPSDYRPEHAEIEKIKKNDDPVVLKMVKNPDILRTLGDRKHKQFLVGFAAETQNLEAYALKKLDEKNLDMIVANNVKTEGAGFDVDTNIVTIFEKNGRSTSYDCMNKSEVAKIIIDKVIEYHQI
jgi:phosphopantothenoylcysteine decarboxylase/phosphopantothenate--cysteine ligase